jgi:hypothetical protein
VAKAFDLVCEIVPAIWRCRNEAVHGRTTAEKAQKERERVHSRVRRLYEAPPALLSRYDAVERVPLEERLKKPTFVLQLWFRQVARQAQVSALAQQHSDERQQSIGPFLVRRPLPEREVLGVVVASEEGMVFDRGK